jgi:hypothetical protein
MGSLGASIGLSACSTPITPFCPTDPTISDPSFSIVASSAGELSGCDSSAEAETRAEGEEMTKIPGGPPKPITKAEREARKVFRQLDAE